MRFFNRYTLLYAIILIALTIAYYVAAYYATGNLWPIAIYIMLVFGSALVISIRDKNGYAGLSYHLTTYIIVNGTGLIMAYEYQSGYYTNTVLSTMLIWGIGLLFHFAMYLFIFRKKNIGSYEKDDVFK